MSKISLILTVDQKLHDQCVALGIDPAAAAGRALKRLAFRAMPAEARAEAIARWRADAAGELRPVDPIFEGDGLWSDGVGLS